MFLTPKTRSILAAIALSALGTQMALADKVTILTPEPAAVTDIPADAVRINIAKMKYDTPEVTIKSGRTVTWVNTETMPHNVAFRAGMIGDGKLDGAMLKRDETYSITFNEPGTYDYFCTPHPFMKGKVIVE